MPELGALTHRAERHSLLSGEKKRQSMERLLKRVPGLSEHERILFARSLSATPDERWAMHQAHLRSLGGMNDYAEDQAERGIPSVLPSP